MSARFPARALFQLAGGVEVRGRYRTSLSRIQQNGDIVLTPLASSSGSIRDSEILIVQPSAQETESRAVLSGGTPLAGQFAVGGADRLSDILRAPGALGRSPYTLFGVISRSDAATRLRTLVAFTPVAVLNGGEDMGLQSDDVVRPISVQEERLLTAVTKAYRDRRAEAELELRAPTAVESMTSQSAQQPPTALATPTGQSQSSQSPPPPAQWFLPPSNMPNDERRDIAELSTMSLTDGGVLIQEPTPPIQDSGDNFERQELRPGQIASNLEAQTFGQLAQQLNIDPLVLVHFLMDHEATIGGAVRGPGSYLVGPHVDLQTLVMAAGGTISWADDSGVELISTTVDPETGSSHTTHQMLPLRESSLSTYTHPSQIDEIRFNKIYAATEFGSVTVQGQVDSPVRIYRARRAPVRAAHSRRRVDRHRLSLRNGLLAQVGC